MATSVVVCAVGVAVTLLALGATGYRPAECAAASSESAMAVAVAATIGGAGAVAMSAYTVWRAFHHLRAAVWLAAAAVAVAVSVLSLGWLAGATSC